MSIITKMRKQDAVYWPPAKADNFGRPAYGAPVDVKCRWDDVAENFIDPKSGTVAVSNSKVYVDRDVALDGWLWLGTVATIPGGPGTPPGDVDGALPVRKFEKNPNLKASEFLRTATL